MTLSSGFSRTQHRLELIFNMGTTLVKVEPDVCIGFPQLSYSVEDLSVIAESKSLNSVVGRVSANIKDIFDCLKKFFYRYCWHSVSDY